MKPFTFFSSKALAIAIVGLLMLSGLVIVTDEAQAADITLDRPRGVCTDGTYIYVIDTMSRLAKFSPSFGLVKYIGSVGTGNDQFDNPDSICTDGTYLYITDMNNNRIQKRLCSDLSFVSKVGTSGSGNDQFNYPKGIATDGTHLYIADGVNKRIQKRLCSDLSFVSSRTLPNELLGICVSGGTLFVGLDTVKSIYAYNTADLARVAFSNILYNMPRGLSSDGTYLYVSCQGANEVRKLSVGNLNVTLSTGTGVLAPCQSAIKDGYLYVGQLDYSSGSVSKLNLADLSYVTKYHALSYGGTWVTSFTTTPSNSGHVGTLYSYTPWTNETATITAPTLPVWASFSGGAVSGSPTAVGDFSFSLKAVSTAGTLSSWQNWTVTVSEATSSTWAASFTTTPLDSVTLGNEYNYAPGCNETVSLSAESFPDWAGLVDGVVIGFPNVAGSFSFSLKAVGAGTIPVYQNWTVTVSEATPTPEFTNSPDLNGTRRVWYAWTPTVTLSPCYFTLNGTASFLTINSYTGKISGLPTSAGTFNVTITALATDYGTSASISYVLTVADALDPPQDTGGDNGGTDNGGSDNGGTIIAAIPDYYLVTGLVILAILAIAIIGASRRR